MREDLRCQLKQEAQQSHSLGRPDPYEIQGARSQDAGPNLGRHRLPTSPAGLGGLGFETRNLPLGQASSCRVEAAKCCHGHPDECQNKEALAQRFGTEQLGVIPISVSPPFCAGQSCRQFSKFRCSSAGFDSHIGKPHTRLSRTTAPSLSSWFPCRRTCSEKAKPCNSWNGSRISTYKHA